MTKIIKVILTNKHYIKNNFYIYQMKKLLILFIFLPFLSTAQEFGFSAGTNYTFIKDFEKKARPGFDLNLVYSTSHGNQDYQLEVGYSQTRHLKEIKYQFLRVAFIPKIYITKGLNIQIGPRIGYLLKGTANKADIKDSKNFAHAAIIGGIGYRMKNYDLSLRYNQGISEIEKGLRDKGVQLTFGIFL